MSGVGCKCRWPLDSCNPRFAQGKPCGKVKHEREQAQRFEQGEQERLERNNAGKHGQ